MKSSDPYGIASHKAKKEEAALREQKNDDIMLEMLREMKFMSERLAKIEVMLDRFK